VQLQLNSVEVQRWTKLALGRFKWDIDAFFPSSCNKVGIDMCIRDDTRSFVLAMTLWTTSLCSIDIGMLWGYTLLNVGT